MHVHSIPGKLEVHWRDDIKAIVDTWENYSISLEEFREAVLIKGLDHSKAHGGIAWIVDSSRAGGAFTAEIQDYIGSDIFPAFTRNGVRFFITILPRSATTKMTVRRYQQKTGPNGLELVEAADMAAAEDFLKGKVPVA